MKKTYVITIYSRGKKDYQINFRYKSVARIYLLCLVILGNPKTTQYFLNTKINGEYESKKGY